MDAPTPLMRQYQEIKAQVPNAFVFFRLGDFYELFEEDARTASRLLGLTLTQRQGVPMCGVPHHSSTAYLNRLLQAGHRIALVEQDADPDQKGLMRRKISEILTPGTLLDDRFLAESQANRVALFLESDGFYALVAAEPSTGEILVCQGRLDVQALALRRDLLRLQAKELLIPDGGLEQERLGDNFSGFCTQAGLLLDRFLDRPASRERWRDLALKHFQVVHARALGWEQTGLELSATGALLDHLKSLNRPLDSLRRIRTLQEDRHLSLDPATIRNLDLVQSTEGRKDFTLFGLLENTKTAAGSRLLRDWILQPLRDLEALEQRLGRVTAFYEQPDQLNEIRRTLGRSLDLSRLAARLMADRIHARDLLALAQTLETFQELYPRISGWPLEQETDLDAVLMDSELIRRTIREEPALSPSEGPVIRPGVDAELDEWLRLRDHRQEILEQYLETERAETGLSGLKLKENRILGLYLELTRTQAQNLPLHFLRKQSLAGAERFTTEKLLQIEEAVKTADQTIETIEKRIFSSLKEQLKPHMPAYQALARWLAEIDVLQGFAQTALDRNYVRPRLNFSTDLKIVAGRHPVVEAHSQTFIPNDLELNEQEKFLLLTGPNMAGKSTYLRQTALIVLMAQMGSFVPAAGAEIGLVDRLFCRVGASDHLARGESTFLVEMNETSLILRQAGPRSLVIMDEVGRGTSTHDGLALAWAVSEHLVHELGCKTLFATHFHELTRMENPRILHRHMAIREESGTVTFLRKVIPGSAVRSYGLYVAQLAGLPESLLRRAAELLAQIGHSEAWEAASWNSQRLPQIKTSGPEQAELFPEGDLLKAAILGLDLDQMRPIEALNWLAEQKKLLTNKSRNQG